MENKTNLKEKNICKKDYAVRINLKTACDEREKLIEFCLTNDPNNQHLAIGWQSFVYSDLEDDTNPKNYQEYYNKVKKAYKKINHVLNIFLSTEENDLFWTRDLNGCYWICRAKGEAKSYWNKNLDIGAIIDVEAYNYGLEVPGQIKASFNRPRGGTTQKLYDKNIVEFSKYAFNKVSKKDFYETIKMEGNIIDNLPDFELEELVISYIQVKYNYYLLSNSIANKSTTIKVECEFISRDLNNPQYAVVQVKGGKSKTLSYSDFKDFTDIGYKVFLYAPYYNKDYDNDSFINIERQELIEFFNEYKAILPKNITQWEKLQKTE